MSSVIEELRSRASERPRRILLPETQDPRILEAASFIQQRNLAIPVVLGRPELSTVDALSGFEVIKHDDVQFVEACAQQLFENREHRGLSLEAATKAVEDVAARAVSCELRERRGGAAVMRALHQ